MIKEATELDPGRIAALKSAPAIISQRVAVRLIERLATELGGINEGPDWAEYVGLCKGAEIEPRLELFAEGKP